MLSHMLLLIFLPITSCVSRSHGTSIPVWIDTDPSVGIGEVDDGLALLQAMNSHELDIRGISVIFGNAGVEDCYQVAKRLAAAFLGPDIPVVRGAASALDDGDNSAAEHLASTLRKERLSIIALGPLTNIATMLKSYPELVGRIDRLVAVGGRRAQQLFQVGTMTDSFPDLNFEKDSNGFQFVIELLIKNNVEVILTPWEISSKVWVQKAHIEQLKDELCPGILTALDQPLAYDEAVSHCSKCHRLKDAEIIDKCAALIWVLDKCVLWEKLWSKEFGTTGFNPFDTLAVGYLIEPSMYECNTVIHDFINMNFSDKKNGDLDDLSIEAEIIENLAIHLSRQPSSELERDCFNPDGLTRCSSEESKSIDDGSPQFIVTEVLDYALPSSNDRITRQLPLQYCHSVRVSSDLTDGDLFLRKLVYDRLISSVFSNT